ncbi:MAG: hypothetical protein KAV87_02500, partial [Desulfobacteraceae bacterium]|nr:hypothetical protein [Desulfobacteraceae bacterium]
SREARALRDLVLQSSHSLLRILYLSNTRISVFPEYNKNSKGNLVRKNAIIANSSQLNRKEVTK